MNQLIKPPKLQAGDKIASISLSWGGAGKFPWRYEAGKRNLEEAFGVELEPTAHALKDPEWIQKNPQARADDMMDAFSDPKIKGIISNIGGEDGIRVLPHINLSVIRDNPKVFMGYSDTTNYHLACYKAGLSSFYGPAVLAGFAECGRVFPYLTESVRKTIFSSDKIGILEPNTEGWTDEFLDWGIPENQKLFRKLNPNTPWKYHDSDGVVKGRLWGGCYEILDWHRGSDYFPSPKELEGAILFMETSEEAPPPQALLRFFRNITLTGHLEKLAGILLARPSGTPIEKHPEYGDAVATAVREAGLKIPIVSNMDIGHTDPFLTLPYGAEVTIDSENETVTILESGVV